jgi:hypothetical protein
LKVGFSKSGDADDVVDEEKQRRRRGEWRKLLDIGTE